jgi:hypothetical protein
VTVPPLAGGQLVLPKCHIPGESVSSVGDLKQDNLSPILNGAGKEELKKSLLLEETAIARLRSREFLESDEGLLRG